MNIPNDYIDTITQALRIAVNDSFAKKDYKEEVKFDACLLKIQQLKREKEVFGKENIKALCEETINIFEKTVDLYCPKCNEKYIRYEVSKDVSQCPKCSILLKEKLL